MAGVRPHGFNNVDMHVLRTERLLASVGFVDWARQSESSIRRLYRGGGAPCAREMAPMIGWSKRGMQQAL